MTILCKVASEHMHMSKIILIICTLFRFFFTFYLYRWTAMYPFTSNYSNYNFRRSKIHMFTHFQLTIIVPSWYAAELSKRTRSTSPSAKLKVQMTSRSSCIMEVCKPIGFTVYSMFIVHIRIFIELLNCDYVGMLLKIGAQLLWTYFLREWDYDSSFRLNNSAICNCDLSKYWLWVLGCFKNQYSQFTRIVASFKRIHAKLKTLGWCLMIICSSLDIPSTHYPPGGSISGEQVYLAGSRSI